MGKNILQGKHWSVERPRSWKELDMVKEHGLSLELEQGPEHTGHFKPWSNMMVTQECKLILFHFYKIALAVGE